MLSIIILSVVVLMFKCYKCESQCKCYLGPLVSVKLRHMVPSIYNSKIVAVPEMFSLDAFKKWNSLSFQNTKMSLQRAALKR
jgi:hypothetical protein